MHSALHATRPRAAGRASIQADRGRRGVGYTCRRAWIGQNIFSYAQWLACGYVVNCPESAATVTIDLKEIGPTYYFAPPRIFEGLLTTVMIRMEDAGRVKKWLFDHFMALARRVGPALMDGKPVSAFDRLHYRLGDLLVYGPLRNTLGFSRVRVAYTAGEGDRAGPVHVLPLDRHQPQAASTARPRPRSSSACSPTTRPRPTPWASRSRAWRSGSPTTARSSSSRPAC